MKHAGAIAVTVAAVLISGCWPQPASQSSAGGLEPWFAPADEPAHPPVYVRPLPVPAHPALSRKVHVNFPPGGAALQTAIVKGLPFAVTVAALDELVDLNTPISVRADGVTVEAYLKQLEGESGYRIKLLPEKSIVEVAVMITRTWHLPALAGMGNFNARLGFGESDGGEGSDSGVERSHTMNSSLARDDEVWQSIVDHAHCILGTGECLDGGQTRSDAAPAAVSDAQHKPEAWLVDNRRLGTISAGGRPQPMAMLDRWLSEMVADSLRLVRLECAILDVAVDEQRATGVNFDAIFGDDADFIRIMRQSGAQNAAGGDWTVGAVLDGGRFDLDFFIRRLARRTDVEVKSRARLVVTNAATAYLNTGEVFSYLSGIESVATEGVATTSFEQSRLQIGLELAVTPRILDDGGRMLVEVVPILSSVVRFDELGDGANRVNTPVIALRQMSSQAITRSGRPVVIGGLSWKRLAASERSPGVGAVLDKWLSSRDKQDESRQLLIVITPWEVTV